MNASELKIDLVLLISKENTLNSQLVKITGDGMYHFEYIKKGEPIIKHDRTGLVIMYKLLDVPIKNFKDCDEYAAFVLDELLSFGDRVTEEFNSFTVLSLPIGANVYEMQDLPNTGKNYDQFGTVKAWLYDLYEMHIENNLTTIEII